MISDEEEIQDDQLHNQLDQKLKIKKGGSTTGHASDALSQSGLERGDMQIDVDDQWEIINAFFDQNGVVNQ